MDLIKISKCLSEKRIHFKIVEIPTFLNLNNINILLFFLWVLSFIFLQSTILPLIVQNFELQHSYNKPFFIFLCNHQF